MAVAAMRQLERAFQQKLEGRVAEKSNKEALKRREHAVQQSVQKAVPEQLFFWPFLFLKIFKVQNICSFSTF
jgi:hypothetical protein